MLEIFFDRIVKESHELHMVSMTMDYFINIFLDLLHYVPYIKDEKLKIHLFLGFLLPNFRERIEFDMPKTLDATLHKARLYYEHGQLRKENMNRNRDKYKNFSDNCKLGFKPPPYKKHNNSFPANKNFNKLGTKPYVPAPNVNKLVEAGGRRFYPATDQMVEMQWAPLCPRL